MGSPCPDEFIRVARQLADASGAVIRPHFRADVAIEDKPDQSPVTVADKAAEQAIRGLLERHYPEHGILGEEFGAQAVDVEHLWVIDPIDGTRSFICGVPAFTTLIALLRDGEPILGVIDQPISGERWIGASGHGTTLNGTAVSVRESRPLAQATMFTTTPEMFEAADTPAYNRLWAATHLTRFGLDGYAGGLLAAGLIDLHVEGTMSVWDYMALVPVIENAGGRMTDWQGNRLTLEAGRGLTLATTGAALHDEALALLNRA